MSQTIYTIGSTDFEFEIAGIIGIITEDQKFCWAMDLYAKSRHFQGNPVSPKFSFIQLEPAHDFQHNASFSWKEVPAYNDEIDDWIGSFYIYDSHFFVVDIQVKKVSRESFWVSVTGKVNLNWATEPAEHFEYFTIAHTIPFNGILSEIDDEKKARKITRMYLDPTDLIWVPKEESSSGENHWLRF